MSDRFSRLALLIIAILIALYLGQPLLERTFLATTTPRAIAPRGDLSQLEKSTIEIFERTAPSVVQVVSLGGDGETAVGTGTGFVWDAAGHVVTNNHVIEPAHAVAVRFAGGAVAEAEIVGRAPNYDLAVLRLRGRVAIPPPVPIGTSADLKVGQLVFAIGNPFGLDQTLTTGIISALKRRLPTSGGREIADVIQTDAAINPGNSGGPLLDSAGRLIGVTTAIYSPSGAYAGIGFAIPVDIVNRVVPELIRNGRVPVAGIGILAADEGETSRRGVTGVVVAQVVPGSPAERAGLQGLNRSLGALGDVITEVNGRAVRRLADLADELERAGIGQTVTLTLRRGSRTASVSLPVADVGQR